ncbi:cytochrome P450 [Thalassococcus sp. S3]|uniref:cytochrome P450 n=1 Tax=Thalassococcus sp. S3 TaxID=2017482 RepID=UPI001024595D|nr:cytochrome P450 [Thalassococcus sp. S3]QBF29671.1 cytochrome [Thalassococcus sp. S3]
MTAKQVPVFDANSEFHDNLGALKVVELGKRRVGDVVNIQTSHGYGMILLSNVESVRYWKNTPGHFLVETPKDDFESQADITRILHGDALDKPENAAMAKATRTALSKVQRVWDGWADAALERATTKLCAELADVDGSVDLRVLCAQWSVRAVFPAIFGDTLPAKELAAGITEVERFYYVVSSANGRVETLPQDMPQFQVARAFLDKVVGTALDRLKPGDQTVLAYIAAELPQDATRDEKIEWLRPTMGQMLLEKLNVEGMGLFWALLHMAMDPDASAAMAHEMAGVDPLRAAPDETPLCNAFVLESQRLYPEQPLVYRFARQDLSVEGYHIPKGSLILFAPWLVQRDGRYWKDPQTFDAKRFLTPLADKCTYFPFGIGPRVQTRARFMQRQTLTALRAVASHSRISLAPDCPRGSLRPFLRSTLAPRGPVPVRVQPCQTAGAVLETA